MHIYKHNVQEPRGVKQEGDGWPDDELLAEGRGCLFPRCSVRRSQSAAVFAEAHQRSFYVFFVMLFNNIPHLIIILGGN